MFADGKDRRCSKSSRRRPEPYKLVTRITARGCESRPKGLAFTPYGNSRTHPRSRPSQPEELSRATLSRRRSCLPVSAFTEEDQKRLQVLYSYLQELMVALAANDAGTSISRVEEFLRAQPADEITEVARQFGKASYAARPSPMLAKTIHDLRGGGLTPLIGQLQLAQMSPLTEATSNALYFLTRDHLKIMRNARWCPNLNVPQRGTCGTEGRDGARQLEDGGATIAPCPSTPHILPS